MRIGINILILYLILLQSFSRVLGQGLPRACGGTVERYKTVGYMGSDFFWSVEGGTIQTISKGTDSTNSLDTSIIEIAWNTDVGYHTLMVTEHSNNLYDTCIGPTMMDSVEVLMPDVIIAEKDGRLCADGTFTLHATTGYDYYIWDGDSTTSSNLTTNKGGYHSVFSRVYIDTRPGDSVRCTMTDTAYLIVDRLPVVQLPEDTTLCMDETLELIAGIPDSLYTYLWSTNAITESITIGSGEQEIWVRATSQQGCVTYDTINIKKCSRSNILGDIPNTFTPNNDGVNDRWHVANLDYYPDARIEIYDRSGRLVWKSIGPHADQLNQWDGKDLQGQEMQMGGYYFIINLNRDGVEPIVGHINLVR